MRYINQDEIIRNIINKQLEKHKVDFDYVRLHNDRLLKESGKEWYAYYTFDSKEEYNAWKVWSLQELKKLTPKPSWKTCKKLFEEIDLMWGLRQDYET